MSQIMQLDFSLYKKDWK